jgi:prepilin-type N-terminal cleavage/methylation domain-containing protein
MRCRSGYSMVELILVMAIIVIVSALASPLVFQGLDGPTKVNAAADVVRSCWADCRTHAIEEGKMYQFSVIPNSGKYKIEPFTDGLQAQGYLSPDPSAPNGAEGGGAMTSTPATADQGYVVEGRLPHGVRFATKDTAVDPGSEESDGGTYTPVAVFLPDGSASDDAQVHFGSGGSAGVTLNLRKLTGTATTVHNKGDGN